MAALLSLAVPASVADDAPFHTRSPYPTLAKTKQFLSTLALRALADYRELGGVVPRPGIESSRLFTRKLDDGGVRSLDLAIAPYPERGWEIYISGRELRDGVDAPNPDRAAVEQALTELTAAITQEQEINASLPLDLKSLSYRIITLSYVQTDHALALLKALGYLTIEYTVADGETVYDKVFSPTLLEGATLPVIVKLADSSKTSLQDPAPGEFQKQTSEILPDLGGVYLHHVTSGEPQQRLLVVYDPSDLATLERLLNLVQEQVDLPSRQVVIEALVIELETSVTRELGVTWATGAVTSLSPYKDKLGVLVGPTNPIVDPATPVIDDSAITLDFSRMGVGDLFAFKASLKALLERGKAQILSSPSVLVLDGRQAKIQIGNKIPVTQTTLTNNATTTSFEYFPVGIVLNLRPRVSGDGSDVVMQVETIVSSVRESIIGAGPGTRAPEVQSRQVQSFVRVANDTPFIVGGLTSRDETELLTGVPGLSDLPLLGKLFSRTRRDSLNKEIIIVVTPHVVPVKAHNFSLVIPQQTPIFDSFGHELFRNAYRVRDQDIFELSFLSESRSYRNLLACTRRWVEAQPAGYVPSGSLAPLLKGVVPGEEILVLKMMFEIVRKTDYARFVDPDKIFLFEEQSGEVARYRRHFLPEKLNLLTPQQNALVLGFNAHAEGTIDHPFVQPQARVSYDTVTAPDYDAMLSARNVRTSEGDPDVWSIVLSDAYTGRTHPLDLLKGVIVLRRLLDLNAELPLTLEGFHAGRQLVFPTEDDLRDRFHLLDNETARLFYQVSQYYPAFEEEFKHQGRQIVRTVGDCEGWSAAPRGAVEPAPAIHFKVESAAAETDAAVAAVPEVRAPAEIVIPAAPRPAPEPPPSARLAPETAVRAAPNSPAKPAPAPPPER